MDNNLRDKLIAIAREKINNDDVSHDISHTLRVLENAEMITKEEKADFDIIVPAALFHDLVVYPKDHPKRYESQKESAELAAKILQSIKEFPKDKIEKIKICILECSFSKGIMPKLLESKILQDADGLEATGAISIMRTFSSAGQTKRVFYDSEDPFCEKREPAEHKYAVDLFFTRLLKVRERMHTKRAREIAERRTDFLREFLKELKLEIDE